MRDLPDSGQISPSSSWVLLRPLLGTASTCLYRISSSSWASRQGLLKFVPCKGIHLGLWQCFINQLCPFVNIPPWIYPNSNGLRHQQPILPDLEQVLPDLWQVLSVLSLCFSLPLFVAARWTDHFWVGRGGAPGGAPDLQTLTIWDVPQSFGDFPRQSCSVALGRLRVILKVFLNVLLFQKLDEACGELTIIASWCHFRHGSKWKANKGAIVFWSFGAHLIVCWFHQRGSNQENDRNTTNELMSWLTRLGIQAIWVWVKMGAILFKLQDLPKLYWRVFTDQVSWCLGSPPILQGLVNVPFWEYWTSPYSSHYRPYTIHGWVMWNMGTFNDSCFRSTRAPQIGQVEAMLFCLCLKTQLPVKLMACLVRLCIAYMSRWQNGRNPGTEVLTSENPKWII